MAVPNEFLADITLTKSGAELIQSFFIRIFCEGAIDEARKSVAETTACIRRWAWSLSKTARSKQKGIAANQAKGITASIVPSRN